TLAADSDAALLSIGAIFVNTNLSAAMAATATMIFTWIKYKEPDISMTLNGALAGLVAITAGCDAVSPLGAIIIGAIAGIVVVVGIEFIDKVLRIDDPVGAIGVHGISGALGTILVGFFSTSEGLFYGGGARLLGVQTLGVISVMAFIGAAAFLTFFTIKKTIGLRVSREEELIGLDIKEHNLVASYADFMPYNPTVNGIKLRAENKEENEISVDYFPKGNETKEDLMKKKMSKLVIIFNQTKYEAFIRAMNDIGITGMTLSYVHGCGIQKGKNDYYRGVKYDINLLPKVKVEIIVSEIPVNTVIEAAKSALHTGNIGDGKIFVYDVERVVKIRTGEENYFALQDCD
ncbi:MAG: P-II family nitrogen regulator, partial [Clostridia bacterium]|nr:P-II family nitrogen regulator [Clostridia bacterium]